MPVWKCAWVEYDKPCDKSTEFARGGRPAEEGWTVEMLPSGERRVLCPEHSRKSDELSKSIKEGLAEDTPAEGSQDT